MMFLLQLAILLQSVNIDALDCYKCTNVNSTTNCHNTVQCKANEKCFTKATGVSDQITYMLGCSQEQDCLHVSSTTVSPISIIGRSTSDHVTCSQCCSVDGCNKKLCSFGIPIVNEIGDCKDDPSFDCERVSSIFDVCTDVNHAKTVCRKYCGLCNVIDGSWSFWSNWTSCDVTCESGQMTRTRTCSDPAPAHGGLDCVGNSTQHKLCTLGKCPIDGGWSRWSVWGSCSVTCGVGLQRRDRHCSSPYPDRNGFHCFGDSRDDRGCFERGCSDGQWSTWSDWRACSVSCGSGLRQRTRLCDNPSPSVLGRSCVGNSEDKSMCNTQSCPDGQWSTWSGWGACSVSCGYGQRQRTRRCDNPSPSVLGRQCIGNSDENSMCNPKSCPVPVIIFSAYYPSPTLVSGSTTTGQPIFTKVITNIGNCYNKTSGDFTCTVAGTYQFSISFTTSSGISYCYIRHNDSSIVRAYTYVELGDSWKSASTSTYLTLAVGDRVNLYCGGWTSVEHSDTAIFSGALIAAA